MIVFTTTIALLTGLPLIDQEGLDCLEESNLADNELHTKAEIDSAFMIPWGNEDSGRIVLSSAVYDTVHPGRPPLYYTHHTTDVHPFEQLAIYGASSEGRFRQLLKLEIVGGKFSGPERFQATVRGESKPRRFLAIKESWFAANGPNHTRIYEVQPKGRLACVEFTSPPHQLRKKYRGDVWRAEQNTFGDNGLTFEFYLWGPEDSNCCPNAGTVSGTYAIHRSKRRKGGLAIRIDSFRVEADE